MKNIVAIQGRAGSFHDIAAQKYFGQQYERVETDSFDEVFRAVTSGRANYGVCAIENSLYGSINRTYELFLENKFPIIGEVYLRIRQCLVGLPGTDLSKVLEVHSHPVALAQCHDYLVHNLPRVKRLENVDTATSIGMVKDLKDKQIVAIGSQEAAKLHGLSVLAKSIETNKANYTRFIVISVQGDVIEDANKTSLVIRTNHQPGALYDALGIFAKHSINLAKLQSQPIIGDPWRYQFYVDVDAGMGDQALKDSILELENSECEVSVLGTYSSANKD